jgi:hypothetical protein
MRSLAERRLVKMMRLEGLNTAQMARACGIPRSTVRDWLREPERVVHESCGRCGHPPHDFDDLAGPEYAYLLGMYLGDGVISPGARGVYRLRISTDAAYPRIVGECADAMRRVMPTSRTHVQYLTRGRVAEIHSYSKAWPCYIPQHGPAPKHTRRIALEGWQTAIVEAQPEMLLRGLIHSDGCRVVNRVAGKDYPRYLFTQVSRDITELFCNTCERLGIDFTHSSWKNVSIARRVSVARLDAFVGPKA